MPIGYLGNQEKDLLLLPVNVFLTGFRHDEFVRIVLRKEYVLLFGS